MATGQTEREEEIGFWLKLWTRMYGRVFGAEDAMIYDKLLAEVKTERLHAACEHATKGCHFPPSVADILAADRLLWEESGEARKRREEASNSPLTQAEREELCREARETLAHILKGAK